MITIAVGMMLLAPSSVKSSSEFYFDGGGYSYVFFAGTGSAAPIVLDCNYLDTVAGGTHSVLEIDAWHYVGMQRGNSLTVETLVMAYDTSYNTTNGGVELTLIRSNGQGQDGHIRSSLSSDGLGILWGSGFYTALVADAPFVISQYGERSNPHLTYGGLNIESPSTEGLGYSEMSAQLYENWYYSSDTIFEYLPAPTYPNVGEGDSQRSGYLQLTASDGLDVDIWSTSTAPITYIEAFYHSEVPET